MSARQTVRFLQAAGWPCAADALVLSLAKALLSANAKSLPLGELKPRTHGKWASKRLAREESYARQPDDQPEEPRPTPGRARNTPSISRRHGQAPPPEPQRLSRLRAGDERRQQIGQPQHERCRETLRDGALAPPPRIASLPENSEEVLEAAVGPGHGRHVPQLQGLLPSALAERRSAGVGEGHGFSRDVSPAAAR